MKHEKLQALDPASPTSTANPHHRGDIQGLRALAVVSVVAGHAGVTALGGGFVGVDLFFVLSGYLITELLIREWTRHGRISLSGFWARRVRRLLPAATLVLVATALASAFWLPAVQRKPVSLDIVWSAVFSANWRFAQQGTDYFAEDRAISPVQHYWSLGVEEQFYVLWPLLVIGCGVLAARWARRSSGRRRSEDGAGIRTTIAILAAIVIIVSLVYSIRLTSVNQPYAYFGTPSRAWQLGVGALLAAGSPFVRRLNLPVRTVLAVGGLIAFAWAVLSLDETGGSISYPGTAALVPTLAAAALIAAGSGGSTAIGSALSWGPLQWLGDLSYSLYLWHFPVLVIGISYFDPAGWLVRTGLVAIAVVAAWVSYTWLETPVRMLPRLARSAGLSLALGVTLVAASTTVALAAPSLGSSETTVLNAQGEKVELGPVLIDPLLGLRDPDALGCTAVSFETTENDACDRGDPDGDKTVILMGDSHAASIYRAIEPAAVDSGWRMKLWTKPACGIADVTYYDTQRKTAFDQCDQYHETMFQRAIDEDPDLVVLSSAVNDTKRVVSPSGKILDAETSRPLIVAGYRKTIEQFTSRGIPVVVIQDWPMAPESMPDCLLRTRDARECAFDRSEVPRPEPQAVEGLDGVQLLTVDDEFCDESSCSPVPADVLVYRDSNHFTFEYATSLAPLMQREILDRY